MRRDNKYVDMMEKLQMSQEEKERVGNILLQENEKRTEKKKSVSARRLAAAALAVCLIAGVGVTAYGAVHDQWFSMFFGERTTEKQTAQKSMSGKQVTSDKLLQKLSRKGDIKTQIKEENGYRVKVLSNVYSWKQNMGLLVCSFHFENGDTSYIDVGNSDQGSKADKTLALTAEGTVDYQTYNEQGMGDFLVFSVTGGKDTSKNVKDSTQIYYDGEQDTDGGYLLGIRYQGDRDIDLTELKLVVSREQGDRKPMQDVLHVDLPTADDVDTREFVSVKNPSDKVIVSDFGMTYDICIRKDSAEYLQLSDENACFQDVELVINGKTIHLEDIKTDVVQTKMEEQNTDGLQRYQAQTGFRVLIDSSKIKYVRVFGQKYMEQ